MTTSPILRFVRTAVAVVLLGGPALTVLLADSAEVQAKAGVLLVLYAGMVFAVAQAVHDRARPVVELAATLGGRPAIYVPLRRWARWSLLAVVVAVAATPLVLSAPRRDAMVGFLVLFSPLLLMLPDLVRLSRARLGVWLSDEQIEIESWTHAGRLDWDDVDSVAVRRLGPELVLVLTAAAHVETFPRRRYWIWRFRRVAPPGSLVIALGEAGHDHLQIAEAIAAGVDDVSMRRGFGER